MAARSEEDDAGFLAVVLDITLALWRSSDKEGVQQLMEQLVAFINSYVLLDSSNRLAVFAAGSSGSYLVFQNFDAEQQDCAGAGAQMLVKLQRVLDLEGEAPGHNKSGLSSGLSRALCFVNRKLKQGAAGGAAGGGGGGSGGPEDGGSGARVLCIVGSPDDPKQYIAVMNAIFSAQRSGLSIDGCKLGEGHSTHLQQAAHLTGGVYHQLSRPRALLQYLLEAYAADPYSRQLLRLPRPSAVDFRASCFCHKRPIDIGFVCSVCLSIFCEKLPACITCGADFSGGAELKALKG